MTKREELLLAAVVLAVAATTPAQDIVDAVTRGDLARVKELVETNPELAKARTPRSATLLHVAARLDNEAIAASFIEKGADVNAVQDDTRTPLVGAGITGARVLTEHGANIGYTTRDGFSAISLALHAGDEEVFDYPPDRKAKLVLPLPDTCRRPVAIEEAMRMANPRVVAIFCEQGLDKSFENAARMTLAHFAAERGSAELMQSLVAYGAPVDRTDIFGWTPLHTAAYAGNQAAVEALHGRGVNKNARTVDRTTPCVLAREAKKTAVAGYLAAWGGRNDVDYTDRFTASAAEGFTLAMRVQPHVTVVGDLTEGAFSAQAPDRMPNGWTLWVAFHVATDHNGVNWDGIGIPPDLRIVNTAADIAAGIDRPIEFALDLLDKGAPAPQDESSSLENLRASVVLTYLETAKAKGAPAAEAEMQRLRVDRSGRYFFSPDEAMQQAGPLLGRKQYAEAIPLLLAVRDEIPQFAAAYAMLAQAYLGSGNLAAAEAIMARVEKVEPMLPWAEVAQIEAAKTAIRKQKFGSAAAVLERALAEGGVPAAVRAFQDLLARRDRGGPVIDEGDFNALGYTLLQAKNTDGALYIFEKNAALHPTSWNAWDSLGEAQAGAGRRDQAIESYRKALALNPSSANARAKLKELEKTAPAPGQSIFDAVKTGTPAQVQALAAKDASLVSAKDATGKTPLHHAAIVGSVPMIECLLSLGAAIDAATTENLTPLLEAVRTGKDAAANALIERGAKIDGVLHWAARLNRTAVIETLVAKGAELEARDPQGFTPLTSAARMGGPFEGMELLVRKGANFNLPDSLGNTPLDNAIIYGGADSRTIDLLLARSAAVNTEPAALASTLSAAAQRGHVQLFDYYLARGGETVLATDANRRAVMRSATMGGALEMVKALQARGIPLDLTPNRNGATPVHSLASNPKALDMIEFLVRNGADVSARTNDGRSAHNIADAAGNREVASLLLTLGASAEPQQFPRLTGPYLGQPAPADELRPFAPGIVYLDHGTVSVSPDGQEMYWPTGTAIMMTRIQDGRWTKPAFAPFSGPSGIPFHDDVPFVTPDNKRLFFTSKRPVAPGAPEKENIWFVERTPTGWSEPRSVGPAVNAMSLHWQVSVSNAGTLYFGGRREKDGFGSGDIYCSRLENGHYTEPVNLGPAVNTKDGESQVFIAPDESFILFWRAPGQIPSAYVSVKGRDGQWMPAVTFDLPWAGAGLIVSPDGKYLFAGGQWKSARFLEELRHRESERRPDGRW